VDDNGGFVWVNEEQMPKWGNAERTERVAWTGTVHRATCRELGRRGGTPIKLTDSQLHPRPPDQPPQTCEKCGGDGKPFRPLAAAVTDFGCPDWERERDHKPHRWRDDSGTVAGRCPGWPG